jgi:D-methionine transport system ATP-binding protein
MIKIQALCKSYKIKNKSLTILEGIDLEVKKGEIFGIIGRSGAGKSTLLECVNFLTKPDSGRVIIDDIDLSSLDQKSLRQLRQKIGVIFQAFNLLNSKTVFENIALPLILEGKHDKLEIAVKVKKLLELVELKDYANKYPNSLSGGQKQRVGIARALATDPKILLSDEATSSLDPQTTNAILDLLLSINQKLGLTILLITHEIEVIRKICDKVAVLDHGKIVEQGQAFDILLHPKNNLTRKLVLEEETENYLKQIEAFYKFEKSDNNHLMLLSFVGNNAFEPILDRVSKESMANFSILRGSLDRIKKMPFGQLLIEISGTKENLDKAFIILKEFNVNFEVIK